MSAPTSSIVVASRPSHPVRERQAVSQELQQERAATAPLLTAAPVRDEARPAQIRPQVRRSAIHRGAVAGPVRADLTPRAGRGGVMGSGRVTDGVDAVTCDVCGHAGAPTDGGWRLGP
ncbi:MAG: hypothetical protein E7D41_07945, partial [Cutibacterium sp.]|nr:hypothetical protein [Cutibacterium sp.]